MADYAKVKYEDGTESDEIKIRPKDLILAERHFKGAVPQLEGTFWVAWHKLGRPGRFEEWLETVDELERVPGSSDPFEKAPGDEPSQS